MYYAIFHQKRQKFLHINQKHAGNGPMWTTDPAWIWWDTDESTAIREAELHPGCRVIAILNDKGDNYDGQTANYHRP